MKYYRVEVSIEGSPYIAPLWLSNLRLPRRQATSLASAFSKNGYRVRLRPSKHAEQA